MSHSVGCNNYGHLSDISKKSEQASSTLDILAQSTTNMTSNINRGHFQSENVNKLLRQNGGPDFLTWLDADRAEGKLHHGK